MNLWNLKPKSDIWTGVAIGAAVLAAPIVIPAVGQAVRPLIKAVLKGGYLLCEKGKEMGAGVKEMGEDLMAEVKAEVGAELAESE